MSVVLLAASPCPADLVLLVNGRYYAGRIALEDETGLRIKSGTSAGPREFSVARDEIRKVYRTLEETREIDRTTNPTHLQSWAVGYFHAGVSTLPAKCIRRAWRLKPSIGDVPMRRGHPEFRTLWNRQILKARTGASDGEDVATLLGHARWAHEADLADQALVFLRRAWSMDRQSGVAVELAREWEVSVESPVKIRLGIALETNLFSRTIIDQGVPVRADPDREFLMIPIQYDPRTALKSLSKAVVHGNDRQAFYGVLLPNGPVTVQHIEFFRRSPVYERVEFRTRDEGRPLLILRNTQGARVQKGDSPPHQDRITGRPVTRRPSGWAILVLEVLRTEKSVTLQWDDGGRETLDLPFIRAVKEAIHDPRQRVPGAPAIASSLAQLQGPSGAIADLVIHQLGSVRELLPPQELERWAERVETKMLGAGARIEEQVRSAVWQYFARRPTLEDPLLDALAAADDALKAEWIEIIRSYGSGSGGGNLTVATSLLGAILTSESRSTCDAALDVLLSLDSESGWSLIGEGSQTAHLAALDRLPSLPRKQAAVIVGTLMGQVSEVLARRLAEFAKRIKLRLAHPGEPVLTQWTSLETPEQRLAYLRVIRAVELGDLIYSRSFWKILDAVSDEDEDKTVRRTLLSVLVDQVKRRYRSLPPQEPTPLNHPNFPMLTGLASNDTVVQGLTDAATEGPYAERLEALRLLIREGFSEQAEKAVLAAAPSCRETRRIIQDLCADNALLGSDGLLAFLGRFLTPAHVSSAELILSQLNKILENGSRERWRVWAAVKAGVDFKKLSDLSAAVAPSLKGTALRWLIELAHLSPQSRQRLAATRDPNERLRELERADLRGARLVDGQYGVLAVLETVVPDAAANDSERNDPGPASRWRVPSRTTIVLPPLTLRSDDLDNSYRVLWEHRDIGGGVSRDRFRTLHGPASFSPRLDDPPEDLVGPGGWGWGPALTEAETDLRARGPAILPGNRPVQAAPRPGTMSLEIGEYLRAGLKNAAVYPDGEPSALIPDSIRITLRYAAFSSYYGVGVTQRPPVIRSGSSIPPRFLMNVMLVLEKMDE